MPPVLPKAPVSTFNKARNYAKGAIGTVTGRNWRDVADKYYTEVMAMPHLKSTGKLYGDESMKGTNQFVREALTGETPTPGFRGSLVDPETGDVVSTSRRQIQALAKLEEGRRKVMLQQKKTRTARRRLIAGGLTAVGAGTLHNQGMPEISVKTADLSDTQKNVAAGGLAAAAGAAPIAQGLSSGALRLRADTGTNVTDVKDLRKMMQSGDVLMYGLPGTEDYGKGSISLVGGDPHVPHVQQVQKAHKGRTAYTGIDAAGGRGGGAATTEVAEELHPKWNYTIRRFKDPEHRKAFLKNLGAAETADEALEDAFGSWARSTRYDDRRSTPAAKRSMLPGPLKKLVKADPSEGRAFCSALTGKCSPVPLTKGVEGADVLPHHVRSSKVLETVGSYRAPTSLKNKIYDKALGASHWGVRGLAGAGLAAGTYVGAKKLMGNE
jgi:hypothetical protein